jgi:protein-tyrosine-phosphatase
LRIVDELALSDRSPSELQDALKIGSNLLAHHLDVLERVGLIERLASAGDGRRKYLRLVPDRLSAAWAPAAALAARRVLFVCAANSARSQLAAALWNVEHQVPAESAGTEPAPFVHPEAVGAAARVGLDLSGAHPRSIDEIDGEPELIVTVCDRAHEALERDRSHLPTLHWSIPDPAPLGSPAAFDDAVRSISTRVRSLAPFVRPPNRPGRSHP